MAETEDSLSLEEVMNRRFALVEEIALIQGRHKAELEPLNEELDMCEKFIKNEMNEKKFQNIKTTTGHMAYFSQKDSASVENFDETLAFILANEMYTLLTKGVNKTVVKEYVEAHQVPPPGVKYETFRDLNWKRGKG